MKKQRKDFGKHYLVEYIGCDPERLRTVDGLRGPFLEAVRASGATMLGTQFHQFEPHGVSAMVFIAESHFSLHTWPEDGYAAFDVLTCGVMVPEKTIEALKGFFQARTVDIRILNRGIDVC
jgi:S-adenosylmethionine decarboxylase